MFPCCQGCSASDVWTARVLAVACLCSFVSGCAASGVPRTLAANSGETYVVGPQDTLYSIAWRHNLDYRQLAQWNNIGSDYRLAIGQVLVLQAPTKSAAAPAKPLTPASPGAPRSASRAPLESQTAPRVRTPNADQTANAARAPERAGSKNVAPDGFRWTWPTEFTAAPRAVPGGGILLFGQLGQDVKAAGSGRVVYTGSGIRGYGNLIIIKHGETLLTSYAHNREILVKEGENVLVGQTIAHMGTGPHQVTALYFELRSNGKPVDPLPYLPVR